MSDTLIVALVSVGGTVLVSVIALLGQRSASKTANAAENERLRERIRGEESAHARATRRDQLIETMAELLAVTDPQVNVKMDYGRAVTLIHRGQLLLDIRDPADARLNAALNGLGFNLQESIPVHARHIDERGLETRALLAAQSELTEAARAVLHAKVNLAAT